MHTGTNVTSVTQVEARKIFCADSLEGDGTFSLLVYHLGTDYSVNRCAQSSNVICATSYFTLITVLLLISVVKLG